LQSRENIKAGFHYVRFAHARKSAILGGKNNGGHYRDSRGSDCLDSPENNLSEFVFNEFDERDRSLIEVKLGKFVASLLSFRHLPPKMVTNMMCCDVTCKG
jgi:hypothetical protein